MALKQCRECGSQVSDKAPVCPTCGAEQPKTTSLFTKIVLGFIVFTVLMIVIGAIAEAINPTEVKDETKTTQDDKKEERSKWGYSEDVSAMTDNKSVFVTLKSDSYPLRYGSAVPINPVITFRCMENKTDVLLSTEAPLEPEYGNSFRKTIKFRLDSGKVFNVPFGNAQGSYDVFLANKPIELMEKLADKQKLLISVNYRRSGEIVLEFDLKGFQEKIKPVRELCNW